MENNLLFAGMFVLANLCVREFLITVPIPKLQPFGKDKSTQIAQTVVSFLVGMPVVYCLVVSPDQVTPDFGKNPLFLTVFIVCSLLEIAIEIWVVQKSFPKIVYFYDGVAVLILSIITFVNVYQTGTTIQGSRWIIFSALITVWVFSTPNRKDSTKKTNNALKQPNG